MKRIPKGPPRAHVIEGYKARPGHVLVAACPICLFEREIPKKRLAFGFGLGMVAERVPTDVAARLFALCPEHGEDVKLAIIYVRDRMAKAEAMIAEVPPKEQPS